MKNLLCIETSTKNCSVAISTNSKLIAFKELNAETFSHAENLHVFINDILKEVKNFMVLLSDHHQLSILHL